MNIFFKLAVHLGLFFTAFIAAYALRRGLSVSWWLHDPLAIKVVVWAAIYTGVAAFYEGLFRTERTAWRFSSARDVVRLAQSTALTALTFLTLIFLSNRAINLPRSTLIMSWLLSLFGLVGVRLLWRLAFDRALVSSLLPLAAKRALSGARQLIVVGEVHLAEAYMRRHLSGGDTDYLPVGIVGKTSSLTGQLVFGAPVIGALSDLERLAADAKKRDESPKALLFLQDPVNDLGLSTELIGRLRAQGWLLLRQPSLTELRRPGGGGLQEIQFEEFLPREPIKLDPSAIEALVRGQRVMVTGAGGSIGSEVCRQLVAFGCSHITLVDHSEFLLFEIDRELASVQATGTRRAMLCNVRDGERLELICAEERPQIVFHAAALKHVTLVEGNPCEGVLTNVKGTLNVMNAAAKAGAAQLVLISTDKAVNPTSIMGATKRIAESLLPAAKGPMSACVVRFGNVLGSAGSVVPIFKDQIERGGPVTVTHEDVERYFMTIPEAVQLVLHATTLSNAQPGKAPRKFVLEMGRPVKIVELARRMIEIHGLRAGKDIHIEITGLKSGEKITEALVDAGEQSVACTDGISEIVGDSSMLGGGPRSVDRLIKTAEAGDNAQAVEEIRRLIGAIRGEAVDAVAPDGCAA